jgi:hypothetical protein
MQLVDAILALPRIALALERLADATDDLRRLADAAPSVEALAGLVEQARRMVSDPARHDELRAALAAIVQLGETAASIGPLAEAVRQLNAAAMTLTTTVAPLSGAGERIGRLVERLPRVGAGSAGPIVVDPVIDPAPGTSPA